MQPSLQNPIVGNSIEIELNDENKLTFQGTNPRVALINTSFIPYIEGNGTFVINNSNDTFKYGDNPTNDALCKIAHSADGGGYTRAELMQQIAVAINTQGDADTAANWGIGCDIRTSIENEAIKIASTKCTLYPPQFDDDAYWDKIEGPMKVYGPDSINNAGDDYAVATQRYFGGTIPRCRNAFGGTLRGVGTHPVEGGTVFEYTISIAPEDADFVSVYVKDGHWFIKVEDNELDCGAYQDGDDFELQMFGPSVALIIDTVEHGRLDITNLLYAENDVGLIGTVYVYEQHQISNVAMTILPAEGTQYYEEMTEVTTSWVNWGSTALEIMVGSGSSSIFGTTGSPSIILGSSAPLANSGIGNVLVCLNLECGGLLSGPKTKAVRKFIYTIPNVSGNLTPCTVIAPFLIPIDLNIYGFESISRIRVEFVAQITDQVIGFTAPASITLGFIE